MEALRSNDEKLHPGRHSIRLKGHDYSGVGVYFLTICTDKSICVFGKVIEGRCELSGLGRIVHETWIQIPLHFPGVNVVDFVMMPNHVHGIIEIGCREGAQHAAPLPETASSTREWVGQRGSLSAIVRSFKSAATRRARAELGWKRGVWQRNYFERVVRDGQEFSDISWYIAENPMKWEGDCENPDRREC